MSPRTVEEYPAAQRLAAKACIHCHQVYDFRREAQQTAGQWRKEEVWVYPLPENIGLTVDPDQGNRVRLVAKDSPAGRAGLQAGDTLRSLHRQPVVSFADVQHALHHAPAVGTVSVTWQREETVLTGNLALTAGWRRSDISWRPSLSGVEPVPGVNGEDLTAEEKKSLGLTERALAFRQGNFVPRPVRQAGIRQNDIILGIDDKPLEMTMRQFQAYIRMNHEVGERVTFDVVRNGTRLKVPMTLPGRTPF